MKKRIIYSSGSPWRFNLKKASGSILWTSDNKRLIDFTSGWNVTNLGWNNLEISKAIIEQTKVNQYTPMWASEDIQERLAKQIIDCLPSGMDIIGRATGGTEANEEALKIACIYTKRKKIIGFDETYHGQSFGTMFLGYPSKYIHSLFPKISGFDHIQFPEINSDSTNSKKILSDFSSSLERKLSSFDVAAVVCEPGIVTGWGDTRIAPQGFGSIIRQLTKKYGTLMIMDEVGTGFSRLGKFFGLEVEGVVPDILTLAKGLSNGSSAIGCMVTSSEIAASASAKSNFTSTFGWVPIACAAARKTLEIHKRDKIWEKAERDGSYILSILKAELSGSDLIKEIKGSGMIIGISFKKENLVNTVVDTAFGKGLHIICDNDKNIQLMPPLTINRNELDEGISILVETIKKLSKNNIS